MLRNQRATLQELYSHEAFLSNLNQELVNSIQTMEDRLAGNVRSILQQQGVLGVSGFLGCARLLPAQARPLLAVPKSGMPCRL